MIPIKVTPTQSTISIGERRGRFLATTDVVTVTSADALFLVTSSKFNTRIIGSKFKVILNK